MRENDWGKKKGRRIIEFVENVYVCLCRVDFNYKKYEEMKFLHFWGSRLKRYSLKYLELVEKRMTTSSEWKWMLKYNKKKLEKMWKT